jgi:NAD(P)-dependent dehydrogenase (short-subunit alcohol dehydrogenase family)
MDIHFDKLIKDINDIHVKLYENNNLYSIQLTELLKLQQSLDRLNNQIKTRIGREYTPNLSNSSNSNNSNNSNSFRGFICYICKAKIYDKKYQHEVYECMCQLCGSINFAKRDVIKDLTGKTAIVTGGRVKIGFETAIRLLKNNCKVIVTSRFVDDCLERYQKDPDYHKFKDNLLIYQLNMFNSKNIMRFIEYVYSKFDHLDYLINNAAQTIRRPEQFYQHVIEKYDQSNELIDSDKRIVHRDEDELKYISFTTPQLMLGYDKSEINKLFPENEVDIYGQQIDLREKNSWVLELDDINVEELAEVYIVNAIAPFILCSKFKQLMTKTGNKFSWIINVTSMEGIFNWDFKPTRHPHTNMAKSALNMMTRTSGSYMIKSNIVMVSVDTGWNNSQHPNSYDVKTPVDCVDGAARILDPIYRELKKFGVFYKDYKISDW